VPTHTLGWFAVELELEGWTIQAEELMVPLHSSHLNLMTANYNLLSVPSALTNLELNPVIEMPYNMN